MSAFGWIASQVRAVIGMMAGTEGAEHELDASPAGVWDSFFAIALATPLLAVGWLASIRASGGLFTTAMLPRYAFVDLAAWILPLLLVVRLAKPLGIEDRIGAYVASTNWTGLVLTAIFAAATLVFPDADAGPAFPLFFGLFVMAMILSWRVQHVALGRNGRLTFICFGATLISGILVAVILQDWLGLAPPFPVAVQ